MTPQEVHRPPVEYVEHCSEGPGKNIEVHGHPLEPEVIINVKQEPQVNKVQLNLCCSFRLNSILGS
jgi:hypothetical protein